MMSSNSNYVVLHRRGIPKKVGILSVLCVLFVVFWVGCDGTEPVTTKERFLQLLITPLEHDVTANRFKGQVEFWVRDSQGKVLEEEVEVIVEPRDPKQVENPDDLSRTATGYGTIEILSRVKRLDVYLRVNKQPLVDENDQPKAFTIRFPELREVRPEFEVKSVQEGALLRVNNDEWKPGTYQLEPKKYYASVEVSSPAEEPPPPLNPNHSIVNVKPIDPWTALLEATVKDSRENPITHLPVTLSLSFGNESILFLETTTDQNGVARSVIQSQREGTHEIILRGGGGGKKTIPLHFPLSKGSLYVASTPPQMR